jgi:maltokinase
MTFEEELAAWLPGQRWFAGKGAPIAGLTIVSDTPLVDGDPGMHHLIVAVAQYDRTECYQVLAGLRASIPDRLAHAVIGQAGDGRMAYEALHDPELTRRLLQAVAGRETVGPLSFGAEPDAVIPAGADSLVLTGEQSNTSLLFGEEAILKVFRRPSPGPNPDLEIPRALARLGSPHVAPPMGWLQTTLDGQPTVLAILSTYLRSAADGWSLAATSVRDLYADGDYTDSDVRAADAGGDFAPEAHRLGEATAEVHRALADAFGAHELPGDAHRALAEQMTQRLAATLAIVPELAPYAQMLTESFAELAALDEPLVVQRIHGDYHLGQVLRTQSGWVLLDFEGEPATPLALRRARSPALRDVACMLRSFDYAARFQLPGHPDPERVAVEARDWVSRNQAAFCAGYTQAGGADPGKHTALLRALVLDKTVYEVLYEASHRPSWLPIPLGSLADA